MTPKASLTFEFDATNWLSDGYIASYRFGYGFPRGWDIGGYVFAPTALKRLNILICNMLNYI